MGGERDSRTESVVCIMLLLSKGAKTLVTF